MMLLILGTLLFSRDKIRQLTLCLAHPLMRVGHHARVMRLIWMKTDVFEIMKQAQHVYIKEEISYVRYRR